MDTPIKDTLDKVVQRLEKIEKLQEDQIKKQSQTDQIIERLDSIHNRLERQSQKQTELDVKMSDVSKQLQEEKVFMRDQLQHAQNEILCRLPELQETRAQSSSMDDKLDKITATNEDLKQQILACEKNLTTAEQTTQQHVKDGVAVAVDSVNELRNTLDNSYLNTFFTKKTSLYLSLFTALGVVGVAVWYTRENLHVALTSFESKILDQMNKTKGGIVAATNANTENVIKRLDIIHEVLATQLMGQIFKMASQLFQE